MKIEINLQEIREKLKAEIGVQDVPDAELVNHKVIFSSPTGRDDSLSMTAHDYVQLGVADYVNSIEEVNAQMAEKEFVSSYMPEAITPIQLPIPQKVTFDPTRIKYIESAGNGKKFVVCINLDHEGGEEQVLTVKANSSFVKERTPEDLTQADDIISFYQWHSWAASLDRPVQTDKMLDINGLSSKLNMMFEGLEGLDDAAAYMR
jgi:predicted HTH transcriptional regulator